MSFDYFNTSYLAFGQKLYSAFATLDSLAKEAKLNIDKIMTYQSLFDDYLNKNYSVPIPQNPESPCRSDNFFDIIDDKPIYINKLTSTQDGIDVQLILVNRTNDRVTRLTGSTSLKEGYCYFLTSDLSDDSINRLQFLCDNSDGFKISYYDMKTRGPGDLLGTKQSGLPAFKFGSLIEDNQLLIDSQKDSNVIIKEIEQYPSLLAYVNRYVSNDDFSVI